MEYFISGLWIALEIATVLLFFSAFLPYEKKQWIAVFGAVWLIILVVANQARLQPFALAVRYISMFLLTRHLFRGHWYTHILLEAVIILFMLVADSAVSYGTCALLQISLDEFVWRKFTYSMTGTLSKLLVLFAAWILYRIRKAQGLSGMHGKWFLLMFLFPVTSIIIIILTYINNRSSGDVSASVFWISISLALANIGIVYLIHFLENTTIQEQEMALLKQQIDHQKHHYSALESSYVTQRKASHEFERHIQTLGELLSQEEYHVASDYVARLKASRMHQVFSIQSKHPVIDVILNQKYQLAQEKEIIMQVQINDLSKVNIPTDILVVLLSNLLDNAIEACQKVTDRKEICCSILQSDGLYLSVRNTSLPVNMENNELKLQSNRGHEHGYGIPAIKYVLDGLNAEYYFNYSNGWFHFVAEIPQE
jgi:signal transduction histidine kinase